MNLNLLTDSEAAKFAALIKQSEHIVIFSHRSPDGDAVGSSLGMAAYLRQLGKDDVNVVLPDMFPNFLQWLPGAPDIMRYDKKKEEVEEAIKAADLMFCLDFNDVSRTADLEPLISSSSARKILVDHHLNPTVDAELSVSQPEASSTCELVFRLIWQMGGFEEADTKVAVPLYCGMMTDTGGFTYNSTRPEIFFIISQLLTKGINKDKIYRNVYNNYSLWRMRLLGYVMYAKLKVVPECHAAYFTLTRQDLKHFHFVKGDAEGLVNMPLQIKGVKVSVSLREDTEKPNNIWVSLRSVDDFPCNKLAEKYFNGGGHLNASGGHLNCSMEEAEEVVNKAIRDFKW